MKTIIWKQFDVAELCGKETIKGVAEADFDEYKDDIESLTALIMVINHKSWAHQADDLCDLYADLYYEYYEKAINYLNEQDRHEELTYFRYYI